MLSGIKIFSFFPFLICFLILDYKYSRLFTVNKNTMSDRPHKLSYLKRNVCFEKELLLKFHYSVESTGHIATCRNNPEENL